MSDWTVANKETYMTVVSERDLEPNELLLDFKHGKEFTFDRDFNLTTETHKYEGEEAVLEHLWPGCTEPGNVFPPRYYNIEQININTFRIMWTNDDEERFITTKHHNDGALDAVWQRYDVGDMCRFEAGAPGVGFITFKVTRKDDTGLWGICNEDTIWVPDGDYFV